MPDLETRIRTWVDETTQGTEPVTIAEILERANTIDLEPTGDTARPGPRPLAIAAALILVAVIASAAFLLLTNDDDTTDVITDDGGMGLQGGAGFTVLGALAEVPLELVVDEDGIFTVAMGDFASASSIAGIERPSLADGEEAWQEWAGIVVMPYENLGPSGRPVFVSSRHAEYLGPVDESARLMGWSVLDVDAFVAIHRPPHSLAVVSGRFGEDPFAGSEVTPLSDGIMTLGEGTDLEMDLEDRTILRRVGYPLRTAHQDGRIAVSTVTDTVAAWLDPSSTLADHPSWAAVGQAFDSEDVMSAAIQPGRHWVDPIDLSPEQAAESEAQLASIAIDEPFDLVGVGWSSRGDELVGIMVWHFGDDAVAGRQADRITRVFAEGRSVGGSRPFAEVVTAGDVSASGPVVVATLSFSPEVGPLPEQVQDWLLGDLPAFYLD